MADFISLDGYNCKDAVMWSDIDYIRTKIGYDDIVGLYADFENNVFTRLCAAKGKTAGSDFDVFDMYKNRTRCTVADNGTVIARYGEQGYIEDGSNGQVMVYQPKFYYKVVPVKISPITSADSVANPKGWHLDKVSYLISDKPLDGFKCHPAFLDANGDEIDGYYIGAFEASLYDTSESEYRKYDTWDVTESGGVYTINSLNAYLADATTDKLCSIAGVKPASGEYSTQFTRANVNTMAKNRGTGWSAVNFKIMSAEQLLLTIEMGGFNSQSLVGKGIDSLPSGEHNEASFTGSTGNGTGSAASTSNLASNGVYVNYTASGKTSASYRGTENLWGNAWEYVDGINISDGEIYYCDDYNYAEEVKTGNYTTAGITECNINGYILRFGWAPKCDWAFVATKTGSTTTSPVGDRCVFGNSGYKELYIGGYWGGGTVNGVFCINTGDGKTKRNRTISGRLAYFPASV